MKTLLLLASLWMSIAPAATQTLEMRLLELSTSELVWDQSRSRFIAITNSIDPKWPTSVVFINPETARVEDSFSTGTDATRLAISSDGQYLYLGFASPAVVRRYRVATKTMDLEIALSGTGLGALGAVPGAPRSVVILRPSPSGFGTEIGVYDDAIKRPTAYTFQAPNSGSVSSLYVPSNSKVYAWTGGLFNALNLTPSGLTLQATVGGLFDDSIPATWNGSILTDSSGYVIDLEKASLLGRIAFPQGEVRGQCGPSAQGDSIWGLNGNQLTKYSLETFKPIQQQTVSTGLPSVTSGYIKTWGEDGIVVWTYQQMRFARTGTLPAAPQRPLPGPEPVANGVIRLDLPVNRLAYDSRRNLVYASVLGYGGVAGNQVLAVQPETGSIVKSIPVGSEPGALTISDDGRWLFAGFEGVPSVARINLETWSVDARFSTQVPVQVGDTGTAMMLPVDLLPVRGQPADVVVSRFARYNTSTQHPASVVLYRDGTPVQGPLTGKAFGGGRLFPSDNYRTFLAQSDTLRVLSVESNGLREQGQIPYLAGRVAYLDGRYIDEYGSVTETTYADLLGSLSHGGVPIPFPDRHQVATVGNYFSELYVTLYDFQTLIPLGRVKLGGPPGVPYGPRVEAVAAGANYIAIAWAGQFFLVPMASLPAWPQYDSSLSQISPAIQHVNLPVSAITPGPNDQLLIATPSSAGSMGNRVMLFDPSGRGIVSTWYVGSEPIQLSSTPDRSAVYANLAGAARIARVAFRETLGPLRRPGSGSGVITFPPDYTGGGSPVSAYDIAALSDGSVAVSYYEGEMAVFTRDGDLRPQTDRNKDGFSTHAARYQLTKNDAGGLVYGYNQWTTAFDLKRASVSSNGILALSTAKELTTGFRTQVQFANGLLYSSTGDVIDPERSRRVGQFLHPDLNQPRGGYFSFGKLALPDPDSGRIYFIVPSQGSELLLVFDMNRHAWLGSMPLPIPHADGHLTFVTQFVKYSPEDLAFLTNDGDLYLVKTSSIPMFSSPTFSPPLFLPSTPKVRLVDLKAQDLAYDPKRDLIYASTPNSEAALGDRVVAIDPASGAIAGSIPVGPNPRRLAVSSDGSDLYVAMGFQSNGIKYEGEGYRHLDLNTGTVSPQYANISKGDYITVIGDLLAIPGSPGSVAVVHQFFGSGTASVYDNGIQRTKALNDSYACTSIQPGPTRERLYCYNAASSDYKLTRLALDSTGITKIDASGPDPVQRSDYIVYHEGLLYTTTGRVINPETYEVVAQTDISGPVAVDGGKVYWLTNPFTPGVLVLRSFDALTLKPLASREIRVTLQNALRLIPCGNGRLAFAAGSEVYIIDPEL